MALSLLKRSPIFQLLKQALISARRLSSVWLVALQAGRQATGAEPLYVILAFLERPDHNNGASTQMHFEHLARGLFESEAEELLEDRYNKIHGIHVIVINYDLPWPQALVHQGSCAIRDCLDKRFGDNHRPGRNNVGDALGMAKLVHDLRIACPRLPGNAIKRRSC